MTHVSRSKSHWCVVTALGLWGSLTDSEVTLPEDSPHIPILDALTEVGYVTRKGDNRAWVLHPQIAEAITSLYTVDTKTPGTVEHTVPACPLPDDVLLLLVTHITGGDSIYARDEEQEAEQEDAPVELPPVGPSWLDAYEAKSQECDKLKDMLCAISLAVGNQNEWEHTLGIVEKLKKDLATETLTVESLSKRQDEYLDQLKELRTEAKRWSFTACVHNAPPEALNQIIGESLGWTIYPEGYAVHNGISVSPIPDFSSFVYSEAVREAITEAGLEMMEMSQKLDRIATMRYHCFLRTPVDPHEGWEFSACVELDPHVARCKAFYKFLTA